MDTSANSRINRRRLLTGAMAVGAVAVVGVSGAMVAGAAGTAAAATVTEDFDELYKGRRIKGVSEVQPTGQQIDLIYIDDDEVHVMRDAGGTYTSSINHYDTFKSLKETAQAAVDTLGDLRPVLVGTHSH